MKYKDMDCGIRVSTAQGDGYHAHRLLIKGLDEEEARIELDSVRRCNFLEGV